MLVNRWNCACALVVPASSTIRLTTTLRELTRSRSKKIFVPSAITEMAMIFWFLIWWKTLLDSMEVSEMEKLYTRREAAGYLGISLGTLDVARNNGLITFVQYVENGCVFFTEAGLQEFIARSTHRATPQRENMMTYRKRRV